MTRGGLIALALAVAACASGDAPVSSARDGEVQPAVVTSAIPVDDMTAATAADVVARSGTDQCGAGELQWLVGRSRTEIPVPVNPYARRVTCTTCPVTEDFSPTRLNIFFDQTTDKVETVRCG